jgi:hypothetical protein
VLAVGVAAELGITVESSSSAKRDPGPRDEYNRPVTVVSNASHARNGDRPDVTTTSCTDPRRQVTFGLARRQLCEVTPRRHPAADTERLA